MRRRHRLAADSPALRRRAVGRCWQHHGIGTVHHLPGVGENLQDHLQIRAVYKCTRPTLNDEVNNPFRKALIGLEYLLGAPDR